MTDPAPPDPTDPSTTDPRDPCTPDPTDPRTPPPADAGVAAWVAEHGLPGLVDVHVHLLPPPIMARVRAHFAAAGPLIGREWPIRYQWDEADLVTHLRGLGVRWFSALPYAHRPGVSAYLNDWAGDLADRTPDCLRSATFFPEPGIGADVARRLEDGVQLFKTHVQVGGFDPRDPLLDPVWAQLEESGRPVVVHAGSGPVPARFTGPAPVAQVLRRFPALTMVIAHLGAPEYEEFVTLAETYERVHLDTTMVFTDFFERLRPFPRTLLPRVAALGDRVLLGTDYPNIPHPYAHQLEALDRLDLGDEWIRAVCWDNAVRLLGLPTG